jgi:uncharacterized membrane protein YjjP (DUF1212 family)
MSKNINKDIMSQIASKQIKMKPRFYFIIGSILTFIGSISTIIVSIFLISLIRFSLRTNYGWRGQYKLDQMISNFPWWTIVLAIISLTVGFWLIHKYDFSYKIKPSVLIIGFIILTIFTGIIVDLIGVNDRLSKKGPMRGMMRNYIQRDI